jgi:hypothetical protein
MPAANAVRTRAQAHHVADNGEGDDGAGEATQKRELGGTRPCNEMKQAAQYQQIHDMKARHAHRLHAPG